MGNHPDTAEVFAEMASRDGSRSGEEYLGYKERLEVQKHLHDIFDRTNPIDARSDTRKDA